ncbi:cupin domain-containing protein [Roseomonas sp. BN140053]|uniref:cupin domain-containing protein n=1 Tax=Roseomonas sp. BN140053 TaxID=3391898 RepID=UPI0039EA1D3F
MAGAIRRVVTGHDPAGKAVVLTDGPAPNVKVRAVGGFVSSLLWVTDTGPADISGTDDKADREIGTAPPPAGTILRVVDFPPAPADDASLDRDRMVQEMGLSGSGLAGDTARHPFMHRTKSVDYALVLSGEIDMLLDDSEVHLKAGDVLIQQGTNHAWVNRGTEPCRVAFVLVDAHEHPAFR